jgi:predicted amidohydrolase YtcJ
MTTITHILTGQLYSHTTGYQPAGAVAITANGKIAAVGSSASVHQLSQATTVHHRYNGIIMPGFCDSHQHFLSDIRGKVERISLWQARSLDEVAQSIASAQQQIPSGMWLIADGHDQGRYVEQRHPTLAELDAIAPHHPLIIHRACHHIALVNSLALQIAGITATTPDPDDGHIGRHSDGTPNGILAEGARQLVLQHVITPPIDWFTHIPATVAAYHRRGITAIGEAAIGHINGLHDLAVMESAHRQGLLRLRTSYMGYGAVATHWLAGQHTITPDEWRNAPIIKYFIDGTLGGLSAWLSVPYRHNPETQGYPLCEGDELYERVAAAHQQGYQVAIHAIGDAAVHEVAQQYARVLAHAPHADHRHRIEHCEVIRPDTLALMAQHGICAAVQPVFTWFEESDVAQVPDSLLTGAHAWGDFVAANIPLAFGSDNPVVPDFAPMLGITAAVTRHTARGACINPNQGISWQQAVDAYTHTAAWSLRRETLYGDLRPGLCADLVVVDAQIADPQLMHMADVQATWLNGECVFQREGLGM